MLSWSQDGDPNGLSFCYFEGGSGHVGDKIEAGVGDNGQSVVVGKENAMTVNENNVIFNPPPPPPPGHYGPNHPVREYSFNDVIAVLIGDPGDPLTGRPARIGIISQLSVMDAHLISIDNQQAAAHTERLELIDDMRDVKTNQHPPAFQILMLVMATAIIVVLVLILVRLPG